MGYPPTPHVILTVSALTAVVRSHVESAFADIWVEGEVSNLRMPSSGHAYFTLKDATSQMRAVMFRSVGRFLRFHLKDGMCVICRGPEGGAVLSGATFCDRVELGFPGGPCPGCQKTRERRYRK